MIAIRSQWASLQDASFCGSDAVRSYMQSIQAQARLSSAEARKYECDGGNWSARVLGRAIARLP